ncbi:molybdopterin molybdenumtransferase MoeA, partial [Candidatus Woesearchaeota archaeon]|nr:molybdopterin molybdenumtransferase MoeA [Candidatus Woesearchaeota archaeon]
EVVVHGIAVKPGKPTLIGKVDERLVLGLPGYPSSALSNFYILVKPLINKMIGANEESVFVEKKLSRKIASTIGRYEFLAVNISEEYARPVMKGSSSITTLADADGFLEIDENTEVLNKDEKVRVILF